MLYLLIIWTRVCVRYLGIAICSVLIVCACLRNAPVGSNSGISSGTAHVPIGFDNSTGLSFELEHYCYSRLGSLWTSYLEHVDRIEKYVGHVLNHTLGFQVRRNTCQVTGLWISGRWFTYLIANKCKKDVFSPCSKVTGVVMENRVNIAGETFDTWVHIVDQKLCLLSVQKYWWAVSPKAHLVAQAPAVCYCSIGTANGIRIESALATLVRTLSNSRALGYIGFFGENGCCLVYSRL